MNAKKKRSKNRRRARKLAKQAWDAADVGNFDLAAKIIGRAVDVDPGNPMLWNDQGLILLQRNNDDRAADAFQAAISLAVDYAEAYTHLAVIRVRQGCVQQAVALQREAVRYKPDSDLYRERLTAYEALANSVAPIRPEGNSISKQLHRDSTCQQVVAEKEFPELATRINDLDWTSIEEILRRNGYSHLRDLLPSDLCKCLRQMFADDRLFAKTVTMDKSRFGKGVYRYFRDPIPHLVDAIRRIVYPHVSQIANAWTNLLRQEELYPLTWEEFREICAEAGQTVPTPLLLKYESGGFNTLHQDIRGDVYFPLQLVIVLSPIADQSANDSDGFTGGEFLFCDQPERKKSDRRLIPAGLGDAVLFCTHARLVRIAGVYGLKQVKHGMERITSGTRYALGVPFHEYL